MVPGKNTSKSCFLLHNTRRKKANQGSSAIVRAPPPQEAALIHAFWLQGTANVFYAQLQRVCRDLGGAPEYHPMGVTRTTPTKSTPKPCIMRRAMPKAAGRRVRPPGRENAPGVPAKCAPKLCKRHLRSLHNTGKMGAICTSIPCKMQPNPVFVARKKSASPFSGVDVTARNSTSDPEMRSSPPWTVQNAGQGPAKRTL